ncbi:Pam1p NDAI_0C05190 [Naumovozyma dairenensis CBS 421]|uniref:Ketopantoate reductase C-terminal domain-containing protein n=1 Tax=Naumovozyma dairenensis (strain ATCC 10597 / BCRC 20456 / CBS 421 / NBRC 0211 / NRRL Y-12639) TaxID=1071378 RepID=G0W8R7_NAUDC|nr:hypothetical protein NDAI_0C05190 [Naumovozyma dairenensis CBS 421]CCD24178.1 hypothetical protein NDAI_0C05190 [Naumovozyma dairenensis CBS 421]
MTVSKPISTVLLVGNNPNITFYTSRLQNANNNLDLFHVSDSKSNIFSIETETYGKEQFELDNHFTSIDHLIEALNQISSGQIFFDLIILNASSLQQLSLISSQLKHLINQDSIIVIESSGFIQIDSYFNGLDSQNIIVNILSDYNICQINPNGYKQLNNKSTNSKFSLTLGKSDNINSIEYPKETKTKLQNLETFLKKFFTNDTIDFCDYSPSKFSTKEWSMAIPKICLDPLLVLLEENEPTDLLDNILAKPLISGLITETMTIAKTLNVKLDTNIDNEDKILKVWSDNYSENTEGKNENVPSILYHFINKSNIPLNFDLLVLQPILLADNFGIKTPYLEFLFAMLSQFEKINLNQSKWFTRTIDYNSLLKENDELRKELKTNKKVSNDEKIENDLNAKQFLDRINELQGQLDASKCEIETLKASISHSNEDNPSAGLGIIKSKSNNNSIEPDHDRSLVAPSMISERSQEKPLDIPSYNNNNKDNKDNSLENDEKEQSLKEREIELQRKELDLKQRELVFKQQSILQQQRQITHKQQQYYQSPQLPTETFATPPRSPVINNHSSNDSRKASYTKLHNINKNGRSTSNTNPTLLANNFVDPISSGLPPLQTSNMDSFGESSSSPNVPYHQHHAIKPTSRKNRTSNMPRIGNPSSLTSNSLNNNTSNPSTPLSPGFGSTRVSSFPSPPLNNHHNNNNNGINNYKLRDNILNTSGLDMPTPNKVRNSPVLGVNNNNNHNNNNNNGQRQISTSTMLDHATENKFPINGGPAPIDSDLPSGPNVNSMSPTIPELAQPKYQFSSFSNTNSNSNPSSNDTTADTSNEHTGETDDNGAHAADGSEKKKKKKFGGLFKKKDKKKK